MRFLPILLLLIGLMVVVVLMSGDRRKGLRSVGTMIFTIAVLILIAAVFAVIADLRS